jgi:hypothetical protein
MKVKAAEDTLSREAEELYWSINMMRNYITLNSTGIAKILKKFDKVTNFTTKSRYLEFIHSLSWFNTKEIDTYAREIEDLFALVFTSGDRKKAMTALRIPRVKREDEKSSFFIGFYLGMCVAIFFLTLFLLSISNLDTVPHWNDVYLVYRCIFLPIILLWLFAINCAIWTRTRIDWVFILELDPRRHITHQQLFLVSPSSASSSSSSFLSPFSIHTHISSFHSFADFLRQDYCFRRFVISSKREETFGWDFQPSIFRFWESSSWFWLLVVPSTFSFEGVDCGS